MQAVRNKKNEFSGHFEALFHNATICIFLTDMSGKITGVNPFALKTFGYTEAELSNKPVELLIPQRYHKNHKKHHNEYFKNPQTKTMGPERELYAVKKDGTEIPVQISLSHYHHKDDQYVIAFLTDISQRKKAEAKLEEMNDMLETTVEQRTKELTVALEELKASKEKLEAASIFQRTIFEKAGAIIASTDANGIIQTFNPEAEKCLGYKAEELAGKFTPALFHCPEETKQKAMQLSGEFGEHIEPGFETFVAKAKRNMPHEDEWTFVRKDGTRFPVSLIVTALRNNAGEITGYIGVAVDISEHKREEDFLRQSLTKEKELSELKSRFVSMASHEFRTPLSTVLSSAYLIEKYTAAEDQPKRVKHLQRIISSVNMLTDILNDFLSVGRIEEGKIHTRYADFNISRFISGIADEVNNTLKAGQIIHYEHEGNEEVSLDPSLLKHIVLNLLSNASKFSSENSPVDIRTFCFDSTIVLKVKDYGVGISKEDQKHLMERFFRGSNAAAVQGTGLGLHIVSRYAELMNGRIECISELEKGTEFIITFKPKTDQYEKDTAD